MLRYYTAIIFISIVAMFIIQVSIGKSWTLTKSKKWIFHLLFFNIALAALCEWLGTLLQGTGSSTRIIHIIVKAVELSVAPSISILIAGIIDEKRYKKAFLFVAIHAVIEWLSGIFGFIYYVDENSNYVHADFYWIYMAAYIAAIIYTVCIIVINAKRYQSNGTFYFILIVLFMLGGIVTQLIDSSLKVDYVVLALASLMTYIFALETIQQTDELSELINRRGYENYIANIDEACVILFFDIDKFKEANDTYGHTFGDACVRNTGRALKKIYGRYGKCFRFGGDEFCVALTRHLSDLERLNGKFLAEIESIRKKDERMPEISMGYACFDPQKDDIMDTLHKADQMMYEYKEANRNMVY